MKRKLPKFLSQSVKESLYGALSRCPRDRAIGSLGLNGGLRVSEIVNLRVQDLDLESRTLRFPGKGGKQRSVPVNLRLLLDLQAALAARPADTRHDLLIWNKRSPERGLSRVGAYRLLVRCGRRIGYPGNLHPHMLRHTAARDHYAACRDIYETQRFLGHSRTETTSIYAQVLDSDVAATLERVNRPPLIVRLLARLRSVPPEWLLRRSSPRTTYAGGTIGRTREFQMLKANAAAGISTVVIGPRGSGKSHLLAMLLEDLQP